MSDTPTYDQLSALCAQMAAALEKCGERFREYERLHAAKPDMEKAARNADMAIVCETALTAYRTLSPDPVWQPGEGFKSIPDELAFYRRSYKELTNERDYWKFIHGEKQKRLDAINRARGEG